MVLKGKYAEAVIYTEDAENEAISQIINILNQPMMQGATVRIMPDVHAGAGIVIGYTATLNKYVVPNFIGVDIGCGLTALPLGKGDVSFPELDTFIRQNVPSGNKVNSRVDYSEFLPIYNRIWDPKFNAFKAKVSEVCSTIKIDEARVWAGIGSLGGGNHFMSISEDKDGNHYFVVHSGSRNFGKCVAEYHQGVAQKGISENENRAAIDKIKKTTPKEKIRQAIQDYYSSLPQKIKNLEYLEGESANRYFDDMHIAQEYAQLNRRVIISRIAKFLNVLYEEDSLIESVHNYINFDDEIIRKGAISAHKGEKIMIPLSMADGILLCEGKGNSEWNFSAPHGAGRLMSRSKAKEVISVDEYKDRMTKAGVWTSCVGIGTLDEAPQAYKDPAMIIEAIGDTVTILDQWKEVYNFKAS